MKKKTMTLAVTTILFFFAGCFAFAGDCVTIPDGVLVNSTGDLIETGYNDAGYNYQANIYNGVWGDDDLVMKWNNAWLSNMDCDDDGVLDRHFGYETYIGSGAWCTNHFSGKIDVDGKLRKWTYFIKIIAVPSNAVKVGYIWYNADGIEIGPDIWGQFAIIQEILNDPSEGMHGVLYKSPAGPGLGFGVIQ